MDHYISRHRKQLLLIAVIITIQYDIACGICSAPALPDSLYGLTSRQDLYITGDTFDLACYPQYEISGESTMVCNAEGQWEPSLPTCKTVGYAPWWALLLGIFFGIILISCCIPRLYFKICPGANVDPALVDSKHKDGVTVDKDGKVAQSEWQKKDHIDTSGIRQRQDMAAYYGKPNDEDVQKAEEGLQF